MRIPLPLEPIAKLLNSNIAPLEQAAERYVVAEDSPAARKLIVDRYPKQYRIFGARMNFDPGHYSYEGMDDWEKKLSAEFTGKNPPAEILAVLTGGYWGGAGQVVVRVRGENAELTQYSDPAWSESRALTPGELKSLRDFLAAEKVDELPPLNTMVMDGLQVEFVRLDKHSRRVFMNNPGDAGSDGSAYEKLYKMFFELAAAKPLEIRFRVMEKMPGSELLLNGGKERALAVWKQGADLRVRMSD